LFSIKSNIWKLYLYKFLLSIHFIGGVLVPFFMDWGQISYYQIMMIQAFFVCSIVVLEIPTGALSDYIGRKFSLILSSIIVSFGVVIYASFPNFHLFLLGEFFWAAGFALLSGADESLLYDTLKALGKESDSKKYFSRYASAELAAYLISAPIGSLIAATLGLRYTMLFMAVPFFLSCFIGLSFQEPSIDQKDQKDSYTTIIKDGLSYFKNHRIIRILTFDKVSIASLCFLLIWTYQPLLKKLDVPLIYFGLVHAAMLATQIFFTNSFPFFEKLVGSKKNYLFLSAFITGILFILLGNIIYLPLTILFILLASGIGLSRQVLFQNYMNKYIESDKRATVISIASMFNRLAMAFFYLTIGKLAESNLTLAITVIGILMIVFSLISRVEEKHLID